ncbi:MAG: type VI secretion system tip protein VgrG [Saprospiraceae bacterium]
MPDSPLNKSGGIMSIEVYINGSRIKDELNLISIDVDRSLSRIPTAALTFQLHAEDVRKRSRVLGQSKGYIPGAEIVIKAGYEGQWIHTIFKGIIVNQGINAGSGRKGSMVLRCSDKALLMTSGRKSGYYLDMKDSDIAGAIIADYGLESEVDATAYKHKELVKYQSTDWDFLLTRAAANGLLVIAEDGKVKLKKPQSSGKVDLELELEHDVLDYNIQLETREQISSVSCSAWDMKTQALVSGSSSEPVLSSLGNLNAKAMGAAIGLGESKLTSTAPLEQTELKAWADSELTQARMNYIQGSITFYGNGMPKLNTLIQLKGFGDLYNGDALITGVQHEITASGWRTTVSLGHVPDATVEASQQASAPAASGLLPPVSGLQIGTVKKIDSDPAGEHRIQVNVPAIVDGGEGIWARMAHFYATSGKGAFFLPEVNDEVMLGFLNDDPRFPIILGMLYSSKRQAPYTADDKNSIKAIVTKNDLKIEFNDEDKTLGISTPAGNKFILSDKNKSISLKDQHGNMLEMNNSGINLSSAKDLNLDAKGKINLKAVSGLSASTSGGDLTLEGVNIKNEAKAAFSAKGSAQAELSSNGQTTVKGSMVMIN